MKWNADWETEFDRKRTIGEVLEVLKQEQRVLDEKRWKQIAPRWVKLTRTRKPKPIFFLPDTESDTSTGAWSVKS